MRLIGLRPVAMAVMVWMAMSWMAALLPAPWTGIAQANVHGVEIEVSLPQLGLAHPFDLGAATAVNDAIRQRALKMVHELAPMGNVWGDYEVHVDRTDLFSATMHYAGYMPPMAHPMHLRASVTADPTTGRVYTLADLFDDERYIEVLSEAVALGIEEKELPLLGEFDKIAPDQDFYLAERHLVLYYQLYDLVPYAWGFPEFEIPLESLQEIAKEDGPIAKLLGAK